MNPTSHAAMSWGWAVTGQKTWGWCGPEPGFAGDNTAHVFCPFGLGLDGQGVADPVFTKKQP
jgi:hypothetical protein